MIRSIKVGEEAIRAIGIKQGETKMTVKSIRKDDVNVTAKQLGVKVGDKFVVLPQHEQYKSLDSRGIHPCLNDGDVVVLAHDDGTAMPTFTNLTTRSRDFVSLVAICFSRLARYEEKEKDISLRNVKFDMKAIADELGVSLEKAHYIVQTALFESGVKWGNGSIVQCPFALYLFSTGEYLAWGERDCEPTYKQLSIKPQYSFYEKEGKPETIEFNGKQYSKEDVAKALALLSSS